MSTFVTRSVTDRDSYFSITAGPGDQMVRGHPSARLANALCASSGCAPHLAPRLPLSALCLLLPRTADRLTAPLCLRACVVVRRGCAPGRGIGCATLHNASALRPSFSDGGQFDLVSLARAHARTLPLLPQIARDTFGQLSSHCRTSGSPAPLVSSLLHARACNAVRCPHRS